MKARILTTATLFTAFAGVVTARAADSQLLSLVMPDAKVLAGVNVDQAKATPFGLYVLTQIQSTNNTGLQELIALTGFDPTRDVHELLAASSATAGSKSATGLVLARGNFSVDTITNLAKSKGAVIETVNGVNVLEDPKQMAGIAFLGPTLLIAGDVAGVKAAIVRPSTGQALPTSVVGLANQWSASQDAWIVSTGAPSSLFPIPQQTSGSNNPGAAMLTGIFQQIQQVAAGVKFGDNVVGTASITSDTAANATQLANTLQFLLNMAQMQGQNNAQLANLAKAVAISAQGTNIKVTVTLPQAQFQQLIQQEAKLAVIAK